MDDVLSQLPGYVLRRTAAAMSAEVAARFSEAGLRMAEASILIMVEANPGLPLAMLGRTLGIQRANMAPLIARMEKAGLVEREAIDGRSLCLRLSVFGAKKAAEARAASDTQEQALLARIPEEHRAHFLPALQALWMASGSADDQD